MHGEAEPIPGGGPSRDRSYPSAVDAWLAVVLIGTPLAVLALGGFLLTKSVGAGIFTLLTGGVIGAVMGALAWPCEYTLTEDRLIIRSGILREEVRLAGIRVVEKSRAPWSAPALSLRRVRITAEDGVHLISPRDRDGFMAELTARRARWAAGASPAATGLRRG